MARKKRASEAEQSSHATKKDKNLLTRRNFITAAAGMGAMSLVAGGAQKTKEGDSKMPVWSGDLKSSVKQTPGIPTTAKPNGFNMIVIIADTWRADHLGCYGSARIKTPNLDRLAEEGTLFTDASAEGLPTIPCRRVYHTGKSVLPEAKWQPLSDTDITFAEVLGKHGVSAVDFMPTFLAMLGIDDYRNTDGQNMWKLVTGQAPSLHENVYTVFNAFGAIHNPDWHYFQNIRGKNKGKGPCLYNLKTDPSQSTNIIKEFPDVARDLRKKLENHLKLKIPPLKL